MSFPRPVPVGDSQQLSQNNTACGERVTVVIQITKNRMEPRSVNAHNSSLLRDHLGFADRFITDQAAIKKFD
ncbi:MAG TPA: hypothetical protein VGN34_34345, partial [Ktedonobacteraceae bacterium]